MFGERECFCGACEYDRCLERMAARGPEAPFYSASWGFSYGAGGGRYLEHFGVGR